VDELRTRIETTEGRDPYRLRRQTIELRYADLKEHRQLRRFNHYGPRRVRAQIGTVVLAYNLLLLQKKPKVHNQRTAPNQLPRKSHHERQMASKGG
jgi:hypothetical protein